MEISFEILSILFFVAFSAGTIDTIAGGGGLLTIPALLWAGLPPASALATNKLQSVFGTFTASFYFIKKQMINLQEMRPMLIMAFVGSLIGSYTILQIDATLLKKIIPILLILIGLYFLFSKNTGEIEKHKIISKLTFALIFVTIIGFYDGFLGPGTGSFFTIAFIHFLGYEISNATAQTKVLNFMTNLASLLFFILFGKIYFIVGLTMGIGQILGAILGAKLVVLKGQKLIRPLIVIISFAMSIKLFLN